MEPLDQHHCYSPTKSSGWCTKRVLRGGTEGDRIVLLGQDVDGSALRWSFNDIQQNSFSWRGEISADGGKTWRTEQEMMLKRRTAMR